MNASLLTVFAPHQLVSSEALAGAVGGGELGEQAAAGLAQIEAWLEAEGLPNETFRELALAHRLARRSERDRYLSPIADWIRQHPERFQPILSRLSLWASPRQVDGLAREALFIPPPPQQSAVYLTASGGGIRASAPQQGKVPQQPIPPSPHPVRLHINGVWYSPPFVQNAIAVILDEAKPVFEALIPRGKFKVFVQGPKEERSMEVYLDSESRIEITIAARCYVRKKTERVVISRQPSNLLIEIEVPRDDSRLQEILSNAANRYGEFGVTGSAWRSVTYFNLAARDGDYEGLLRKFLETLQALFTHVPDRRD